MSNKRLVTVGTFSWKPGKKKGIYSLTLDCDKEIFKMNDHILPDCVAGNQHYDHNHAVLYVCDECDVEGQQRPGLFALTVNRENGKLEVLSRIDALMNKPCYFAVSHDGKYGVYSCHTNRKPIAVAKQDENGKWMMQTVYDTAGIGLVTLNEDGSFNEVTDIYAIDEITAESGVKHSHCHSVMFSPSGKFFVTGDKGLDMIYSFCIENGKIVRVDQVSMPNLSAPRYSVFHPSLNVVYFNGEHSRFLDSFCYEANGKLHHFETVELVGEDMECMPSDLRITPDGRFLYVAVRQSHCLVGYAVDTKGKLQRIQILDMQEDIRGMCLTPDGKYLLTAHNGSGEVRILAVEEDGQLRDTQQKASCEFAGNIAII